MTIWLNGDFLEGGPAIAADDRGFLLGDGAFETLSVVKGRLEFWTAHYDRLKQGLGVLQIAPPSDLTRVPFIAQALYEKNGAPAAAALRVTVSRGSGPRGLAPSSDCRPSLLCSLSPAAPPASSRRMIISTQYKRRADVFATFKHIGGYGPNIAALAQAKAAGADDALLLNDDSVLACATAGNVFAISPDGRAATPRVEDGALPGVVRQIVLERCVDVEARATTPGALEGAALLVTNSLIGVVEARLGLAASQSTPSQLTSAQTNVIDSIRAAFEAARAEESKI